MLWKGYIDIFIQIMSMRTSKLLLFVFLILSSCVGTGKDKIFNLKTGKSISGKISDIADSIVYIYLETDTDFLIREIRQLEIFHDRIFIRDGTENLFVFTGTGEYLKKIGTHGKGPGEYIHIHEFSVDTARKIVYILDDNRITGYDYQGCFTGYEIQARNYESFYYYDRLMYCYTPPELLAYNDNRANKLEVLNVEGKIINRFLPSFAKKGAMFITPGQFYVVDGQLRFLDSDENVFYELSDQILSKRFIFRYGAGNKNKNKNNPRGKEFEVKHLFEFKDFIILDYVVGNQWHLAYCEISSEKCFNLKPEKNILGFIDDIYGFAPIYPRFRTQDGFIDIIYPGQYNYEMDQKMEDNPILRHIYIKDP